MVKSRNKEDFRACIICGKPIKTGKRRWICDSCKYKKNLARKKELYKSQYNREPNFVDFDETKSNIESNIFKEVYIFIHNKKWYWRHKSTKLTSAKGFEDYSSCRRDAISAFW